MNEMHFSSLHVWATAITIVRCRMLIVGHSIGGALATLFGYRISRGAGVTTVNTNIESKVSNNHVTVVSFGSPRVGNTGFQRHFDSQPNLDHLRVSY